MPTMEPKAPAVIIQPNIITIGCIIGGRSKKCPKNTAVTVAIINCPSTPMLKSPLLNAKVTLRPVSIRDVESIMVLATNLILPRAP